MKNNTEYRNIWVWMETEHGYTQKVGFELLEKAKILAAEKNCEVVAVIIGNDTKQAVKDVAAYGADQMIVVEDPVYEYYSTDAFKITMVKLIREYMPETVLHHGSPAVLEPDLQRIVRKLELMRKQDVLHGHVRHLGEILWRRSSARTDGHRWELCVPESLKQEDIKKKE